METLINGFSGYLQSSSVMALVVAYLAGILTSFTPCVYPVIPITVSFIGARGSGSALKGLLLSLAYVTGMAVTYTALGAAAAMSGLLFGQIQTNPWMYFFMANLCIFMGMSMLGLFSLNVRTPMFVSRLQPKRNMKGLISSFFVGAASGLIVGPCTAPVLAVLLGYVAAKQNIVFGMSLLFLFAFGMGTLLIFLGSFAGMVSNLPKSGTWMTRLNRIFGLVMIGAGEYFLLVAGSLWL